VVAEVAAGVEAVLPWQEPLWRRLQETLRQDRLPHALLISGRWGLGKRRLAEGFGRSLLCAAPGSDGVACGDCRACQLGAAGTHPDLSLLVPDPDAKSEDIKVDAVRAMIEAGALTAHAGGYRILIIDPADQMNLSAANSLLKTLEEPAAGNLLILVTAQPQRLPATIRSRCQQLLLCPPAEAAGVAWLERQGLTPDNALLLLRLAGGAPLGALGLADPALLGQRADAFGGFLGVGLGAAEPVRVAEAWSKLDGGLLLQWLLGWLQDLALLQEGQAAPRLTNPDRRGDLGRLSQRLAARSIHRLYARVVALQRAKGTTINWQMALEAFLVDWSRAVSS
jgi:DNA polymerase-3 subunit delta'